MGPVVAVPKALKLAGLKLERHRRHRAERGLRLPGARGDARAGLDEERVNVNGGAVALGHPLGASGAKLTVQLLGEMRRRRVGTAWSRCASAAGRARPRSSRIFRISVCCSQHSGVQIVNPLECGGKALRDTALDWFEVLIGLV